MKPRLFSQRNLLFLTVVFYTIGAFLMPQQSIEPLIAKGIANQEEYTYMDSNGDEHEGETLVEFNGIGPVLTYRDIYFSTFSFFIISLIFARCVFNEEMANKEEPKFMIYSCCILGTLLVWLTRKGFILSTILFWLGIVTSYYALAKDKKQ